jgi:pimeloyl-ACP methyl ester carboxylesterase
MSPPRIVVTIHGIRTRGKWQKDITPFLARHGLIPYHLDYGWFNALRFFFPWSRNAQLERTREDLLRLMNDTGCSRLNVIAHSFGTWLITRCLIDDNRVLFDRVVLAGSIVPREFDWHRQFELGRVGAVRNERASADWVVSLADGVARRLPRLSGRLDAGASGREPFRDAHWRPVPRLLDDFCAGHHSQVHNPAKYEQWARFIAYPALPPDLCRRVRTEMQQLVQRVAPQLGLNARQLRANLFALQGGCLRLVPGAHANMLHAPELDLSIEVGHGSTGSAFHTGKPSWAVKGDGRWRHGHLPEDELAKIHPQLSWVVSLPVLSASFDTVLAVVNVDGLDAVPALLDDPEDEACEGAVIGLYGIMQRYFAFQHFLEGAYRGDNLEQTGVQP